MTRIETKRPIMILAGLAAPLAMAAQDAAPAVAGSGPAMETNYLLLGVAVLQVIIILALSSIMRNLGGNGSAWARRMAVKRAAAGAVVLAFLAWPAEASAAVPGTMFLVTTATLFWMLISANLILFVVLLAQLNVLRGMVRTLSGREEEELALAKEAEEPSFADTILHKLTQAVDVEHEEDVLMHHEYDGIRELNNVLPPWWLWLFYGTIIWGVVYLVNVHILGVMPLQAEEYEQEMAQAKEDVAAYLAQFSNLVDESNVTVATDEATLASGESIYKQFCVACHGANGEGGTGAVLNEGEINGQRLFPSQGVANIRLGGSKQAFAKAGYKTLEGGSYRGMWWLFHNEHGAFAARGVHGQTIYVDPTADMVIVRFASYPTAKNGKIDPTSLPAYQAVAEYLRSKR